MEEIIKELREDKKRAWEMIASLNDRLLKAEKQGKDDDLHHKIDRLLEKLEKKTELEENVDLLKKEVEKSQGYIAHFVESHAELKDSMGTLTDKMEHLAEEVTKSKEIMKVIDSAETTVGYSELFVKDFDKIHGKLTEMDLKIEDARQVDHGIIGRMDEIERKIETACQLESKMEVIGQEVKGIRDEIKGNIEMIPKVLLEIRDGNKKMNSVSELKQQGQKTATSIESQKLEFENLKREIAEKLKKPTVSYKCYNSNCNSELHKHLELREDGVSVTCPNNECTAVNIIEKLKRGHKWMSMNCNGARHYQQFPLDQIANEKTLCQICGNEGNIRDENLSAIISYENTETGASYFVKPKKTLKKHCELRKKCWNSNCNFIFPDNIELEEDGVSVGCPDNACRRLNIVGSLKERNRWMGIYCNGKSHYQQFPVNTKQGEMKRCQICGVEGHVWFRNAFAAINE